MRRFSMDPFEFAGGLHEALQRNMVCRLVGGDTTRGDNIVVVSVQDHR